MSVLVHVDTCFVCGFVNVCMFLCVCVCMSVFMNTYVQECRFVFVPEYEFMSTIKRGTREATSEGESEEQTVDKLWVRRRT